MTAAERARHRRSLGRIEGLLEDLVTERLAPERAAPHLREIARLCLSECYYLDLLEERTR